MKEEMILNMELGSSEEGWMREADMEWSKK